MLRPLSRPCEGSALPLCHAPLRADLWERAWYRVKRVWLATATPVSLP